MSNKILVVGAGLAGLSATLTAAEQGCEVSLISTMPSERAQSVMAEGGINAALDTKGENDSTEEHYRDTMKAGAYLADPVAVRGMAEAAPDMIKRLQELGAVFTLDGGHSPDLRSFGGQKKKRTIYSGSSTGKQVMTAIIQAVRRYEAQGLVTRYSNHQFVRLLQDGNGACRGCVVLNAYTGELSAIPAHGIIVATGGFHGLFAGTTGSLDNTGAVSAELFRCGIPVANAEFIQYHPTTAASSGKHLLISEAARGEGGRLYVERNGAPYYFMEREYPEYGNLAPRDVLSRAIWQQLHGPEPATVYLDLTHLPGEVFDKKLGDLLDDCTTYLRIDPRKQPIPVIPGIHYFMGGIQVDRFHRTATPNLYAAGECCCQYHGANRLGGNSLLGAIYGGTLAAQSAMESSVDYPDGEANTLAMLEIEEAAGSMRGRARNIPIPLLKKELRSILSESLGIVRAEETLRSGLERLEALLDKVKCSYDLASGVSDNLHMEPLCLLGKGILLSALHRTESRGAHCRSDYPSQDDSAFQKTTVAQWDGQDIRIQFEEIPERR